MRPEILCVGSAGY